jgi:hypothetical protein
MARAQQVNHDQGGPNGNGAVGDVKRRKRPGALVDFEEIRDRAAQNTIQEISHRAA